MSDSIIVPLDGSKHAENALTWAVALARLYDANIELVHVLDEDSADSDLGAAENRFGDYVAELAAKWGAARHHTRVLRGHPAEAIVDAAARARFLVLASHGRGGFRAAFMGSVADKVLRHTPVPVILVPALGAPAVPDKHPVLVALDGSDAAERGLELARDIAARMGTAVTLVRTWTLPTEAATAFEPAYLSQDLIDSIETGAKEYLAGVAAPGEGQLVTMGHAANTIAEVAARLNAELVVVTTSGKGLAARLALGSTTERLAHSLHRPLLVVPAGT